MAELLSQIDVENRMYLGGIKRSEDMMQRAEEHGRAVTNPYAKEVLDEYVLPLAKAITSELDQKRAGKRQAHAALLDKLGLENCVVAGVSAGGPSAIEFALRYPDRTQALLLIVPRTYDPTQTIGADKGFDSQMILRLVEASADFLFWVGMKVARPAVVRFLGVPPELEVKAPKEERDRTTEIMRNILPLSDRVAGIAVDSSTEIAPWPLEKVTAPTLVISAKDDLFGTLPGARFTAAHIPGAELEVLKSGGHLMLGQRDRVNAIIASFLKRRLRPAPSRKTKAASAKQPEPA